MHIYAQPTDAAAADPSQNKFGVDAGSTATMSYIQSVKVPVGAGPYMAKGATADYTSFYSDNQVKLEGNPNFLFGAPKIKYLTYKVVDPNRKLEEVQSGDIHYSDPSATAANLNAAAADGNLSSVQIPNLGYGYIGINAGKVRGLHVRQAFMTAMDLNMIFQYYTSNSAELINYSMSKVSWAYPLPNQPYYQAPGDTIPVLTAPKYPPIPFPQDGSTDMTALKKKITDLIEQDGYSRPGGTGIYQRVESGQTEKLSYEFTIAGTTDHPITPVFNKAADILNSIGCDITVRARNDALSKLTNGDLAVWAAAWGSTIDPDMFQVYSKYSQATSVKAWGYPYLLDASTNDPEEKQIIDDLSVLIDKGRQYLDPNDRKPIYKQALDKVLDLAVELPAYQRNNLIVYNNKVIDASTLVPSSDCRGYLNPLSRIWQVDFVH